ncbi:uncharacterized protein LOC144654307 [Oculina patagonica]
MRETIFLTLLLCSGIISAQDWKNVGDCGAGLECGPQCQRLCLIQHNYYRSLHNSPPLKCDPQLAKSAQSWADFNAQQEMVQRSMPIKDFVESISWKRWGWKGMETKPGAIPSAVRSWYSEIKHGYDYDTGKGKGEVSHFKSVVHAREARLGCGIIIKPGDGTYVVAHYSLGPGIQFKLNDFSPSKDVGVRKQPDPQCHLKSFEREQCGELKSPLITPDKCINAGCCYDDIFMDEPELQWHNQNATIWCFKKKNDHSTAFRAPNDAPKSGNGLMWSQPPAPLLKGNQVQQLQTQLSPVQDWTNVGSCGAGLTCDPTCQLLCLKMHNYYRSLHNAPPMKCDPELAKSAQEWTDQQAADGKMYHSEWTDKFTESISWRAWGWEGMDKMEGAIPGAVRGWYSEIKNDYNYQTGKGNGKAIGHFQAVVWKAQTKLGCGLNMKPSAGTFVTAHYAPASHANAERDKVVPKNVTPRKPEAPGCNIRSDKRVDCFGDSATELQKVPYVTPEVCLQKGCCYDDMVMSEPNTWFYKPPGRTWCFKKEGGGGGGQGPATQPTQKPSSQSTLPPSAGPPTTGPSSAPGGSPTQQPTSQPSSGNGDKCFANSCYKFYESGKTWAENQKTCQGEGGDLVSMETDAEWKYVNSEIQKITLPGVNEWHIGLKKQGDWKWVSGSPLTIKKWQRYEPSGDGNAVVMSKDYPPGSQGLFNDLSGRYPKPFICEIPKGGTSQPGPQQPTKPPVLPGATSAPQGSTNVPPGPTSAPPVGATTPAVGKPPGAGQPSGGGNQGMTGFEKDCLKAHNEYRAKHGVPPLKWNAKLQEDAQKWANYLTTINRMEHDTGVGYGENIAYFQPGDPTKMPIQCQGPKTPNCVQCREMVADWYAEESNFDYNTGESKGGVITHFTQVVWKATTEMGMVTALSADKWFTVARYTPKGNMLPAENFKKNVPRPQQ